MLSLLVATTSWAAPMSQRLQHRACVHASIAVDEAAAKAEWLKRTAPDWTPPGGFMGTSDYAGAVVPTSAHTSPDVSSYPTFVHAPLSFFAMEELTAKGTRKSQGGLVDRGEPSDFTRPLAKEKWCGAAAGSWACTPGGWDSPKLRPTTETFLVLDGDGMVTDADGVEHSFGAGDVVVLPKHWCGRWDITRHIHKVWVVHDHPDVAGAADGVVRAVVAPLPSFAPEAPALPVVDGSLHEAPANVAETIYDVGPTRVGFLTCTPGSFVVAARAKAEIFWIADGAAFLTNADGSAYRCTAGDTVVLPKGWAGRWDIVEPLQKVWVEVAE